MKKISGDTRVFVVINTTEYNDDGKWGIITAAMDDLDGLGFDETSVMDIQHLIVGEMLNQFDFKGVIVIRIA